MPRLIPRARTPIAALTLALAALLCGTPDAAAAPYTYDQFSMFGQRAAGQLWQGGAAASQFAWSPQAPELGSVYWGEPATWPPSTYERFERGGEWLVLDGYGDTSGNFLPQVVTSEFMGDVDCSAMSPLATDGRQKYVKWTVQSTAYCLHTIGYMVYNGTRIDFEHFQVFWPPSGATCNNAYYSGQTCIKMWERWLDNNGSPRAPLAEKVRRDNIYALGKGWFIITDWRINWRADGRHYWFWG